MLRRILDFLKATPGTVRGILTAADRFRVLVLALVAGTPAGIAAAILGLFNLAPQGLALTVLTPIVVALVDGVRRYLHAGSGPPPPPPPPPSRVRVAA